VIACGALAREIDDLKKVNQWSHLKMVCIDAKLHHRPALIPAALRKTLRQYKDKFSKILVAYADCGTGGEIDRVIAAEGEHIERIAGAHCYEFFAGSQVFAELAEAEPGTFYLTDFLAEHFNRFVIKPLKIDQHPELEEAFFGNYRRMVFLSQTHNEKLISKAEQAAQRLGLEFEHRHCGYGELESSMKIHAV